MREQHRKSGTPEYHIWLAMKQRCHNPRNRHYHQYGERGISVCQEWRESFQTFLDHVGIRPSPELELDRIDNDKGYEPGNVRWASRIVQVLNRRNSLWLEFQGEKKLAFEWAKEKGIPLMTLKARLQMYGWTVERALTTPVGTPRKNSKMLTLNNQTKPLSEWAKDLGMNYNRLYSRIRDGWPLEKALSA